MSSVQFLVFFYLYVLAISKEKSNQINTNVLYIRIGENIFSVNLYENPIKEELISLLPLRSNPIEKNGLKYLPLSLEIEEDNIMKESNNLMVAEAGDILLYKKREIIIVNKKIDIENLEGEYIKIGHTDKVNELYDLIIHNKPVYLWNSFNYINYNEKIKPNEHYMSIMNFITWKIVMIICFFFL